MKQEFPKPSITGDVIVYNDMTNEYLLIKRKKDPYAGKWAIVGGFFNPDPCAEGQDVSVRAAAIRELKEETNIDLSLLKGTDYSFDFLTVQDAPNRDTRGRVVTLVYTLTLFNNARDKLSIKAMDDAADIQWVKEEDIKKDNLAFDHADSINKFIYGIRYE